MDMISMTSTILEQPLPTLENDTSAVLVRASTWEQRGRVLRALALALHTSGCWLSNQKQLAVSQMEFLFEMRLSSSLDVYSAMMAAGLELSHSGHAQMTNLCMMRRHKTKHKVELGSVITVRLQVSFLEEGDLELGMGTAGLA